MNNLKILITSTFLFIFQVVSSQHLSNFDFEKYKLGLKKENTLEVEKIMVWLNKAIVKDEKLICTKSCSEYLSSIPDDIELENEEKPGVLKKAFYKKWASTRDMNRIPGVHPFEIGNGGCIQTHIFNIQFIGSKSNEYYFNAIIYCDNNKKDSNKLIFKIIIQNGKYLIDDVMNQVKVDYFTNL